MRELSYDEIKEVNGGFVVTIIVGGVTLAAMGGIWLYGVYQDKKKEAYDREMKRLIEENRKTLTTLVPYPCS